MPAIGQKKSTQKQHKNGAKNGMFDRLERANDMDGGRGAVWRGNRGIYIIRNLPNQKKGRPVAQVILNSRYLTGLFPTRDSRIFSADIRNGAGKVYLKFNVMGDNLIEIYHREAVESP
jgi:hypothetical protein